jgi:hypothetical protein
MVIGQGGNWAKWLGGEMAKGRIGYGRNGGKIGRNGNTPVTEIGSFDKGSLFKCFPHL